MPVLIRAFVSAMAGFTPAATAGYGQAQRQFSASSNGSTEAIYGGLYGTYIWDQGWYLDAVGKVSALNSHCAAIDSLGQGSSG